MSEQTNGQTATLNPFAFWEQYLEQSNNLARATLDAMSTAFDPQQLQKRWLDALAQHADEFLRSPAFLEAMKRNLKAATDAKTAQDEAFHRAARQLGSTLASDIAGLYERLHSHEHAVMSRLDEIEARLASIATKLEPAPAPRGATHRRPRNGAEHGTDE